LKNCTGCSYAKWDRTKTGRLSPNGGGECTVKIKIPPLPACMYWFGRQAPKPHGGYINRKKELKEHCAYYNPTVHLKDCKK
jgi:hypothetical protein